MRIAVKTGEWLAEPNEFSKCLSILETFEPLEAKRVSRLKIEEDRKRSLTGRLLLRYACSNILEINYANIRLSRTPENKPVCLDLASGDVNISHHGDWVVLASHHTRCVGVDVMRYDEPVRGKEEFFKTMQNYFTKSEWNDILDSLEKFYHYWALKESLIKGIGIGLGFNLQRASFQIEGNRAKVAIDGKLDNDWDFWIYDLDDRHCAAVALGPPKDCAAVALGPPKDFSQNEGEESKEFIFMSIPEILRHFDC